MSYKLTLRHHQLACLYSTILAFCLSICMASDPLREARTHSSLLTSSSNSQVLLGAELYYQNCSVCHGDTATGLAEARLAFPETEQKCEKCHRPNNPPQMALEQMSWRNAFSVGQAPALRGEGRLSKLANAYTLYAYTRASMPRPFPASLKDEDYWAITAFLLDINATDIGQSILSEDNASQFLLRP